MTTGGAIAMSGTNQAANTSRRTNHFDGETEKERESRIANDIARSIVPAPLELSLYYAPETSRRQSPLAAAPPLLLSARRSPVAASVLWPAVVVRPAAVNVA